MGWTYATLVQAIKDYTEYDETTFSANIDNFIQSAEERIFYAVDLEDFRKNATGTMTSGYKYLTAPRLLPRSIITTSQPASRRVQPHGLATMLLKPFCMGLW